MCIMKNKQLTIEEKRKIQLQMLDEFDAFCRKHDLRYSLAYGTLIGAIRHKGFIPWDDDVDIIMPMPDMLKAKELLKSDLIKISDVDSEHHYGYHFPRISHKMSYSLDGLISKSYGVNIDLYYTISVPKDKRMVESFFKGADEIYYKRAFLAKLRSRLCRYLPIKNIPGYNYIQKKYSNYYRKAFLYSESGPFFAVAGRAVWKEYYSFNLFEKLINVDFEGRKYLATAYYQEWLTQEYGDYMQLPPVEDRVPYHGGHYYWKK